MLPGSDRLLYRSCAGWARRASAVRWASTRPAAWGRASLVPPLPRADAGGCAGAYLRHDYSGARKPVKCSYYSELTVTKERSRLLPEGGHISSKNRGSMARSWAGLVIRVLRGFGSVAGETSPPRRPRQGLTRDNSLWRRHRLSSHKINSHQQTRPRISNRARNVDASLVHRRDCFRPY